MAKQQFSMPSGLIDRHSNAFKCIQVPANFGQYVWQEINAQYAEAILDLPDALVQEASFGKFSQVNPPLTRPLPPRPTMPNTSQGARGGRHIYALLHDRMHYMLLLTQEIRQIQELLYEAMGGYDDEQHDLHTVMGLDFSAPPQSLNIGAAYLLRAIVRMRISHVDYEIVLADVNKILETIAQVHRGLLAPAVHMSADDMDEVLTQLRAWESVYLDIQVEWFKLCEGFTEKKMFYRTMQRRREFKEFQSRNNM